MITIAWVGVAHVHTPGFVKRVQNRPEVLVKYVWDHDGERAQRRAAELDAETVSDVAEIWADDSIEAVVICSETDRHEALVNAAAAAGKHMFVEKPLGMGAADARKMAGVIDKAGVIFQTGYFMRSQSQHLFLKGQIEQGHFGKITRIRHSNVHHGSLGGWFDTEWRWMADPAIAAVGGFGDLGTHSLDILMWLMGDVERVTADIGLGTGRYPGCDEFGEGLLHFKNGVVGTLAAGWVDLANPVTTLLSGTEGHAYVLEGEVFFKSEHVAGADGKTPWLNLPEARPHAFDLFLNAISGEEVDSLVSPREAAARSAVMEAMYQAAQERTWLDVSG